MPDNVYRKQAQAKVKLGVSLDDIRHEGEMAKLDIQDIAQQGLNIEKATEGIAEVANIIKGQRRINKQEDEAAAEAEKLGYERTVVEKGSWLGEQGFIDEIGYKDPITGDVFTPEYLTERKEQEKVFREQGIDFDKYESRIGEASAEKAKIESQIQAHHKVSSRVGDQYGALLDVANTFGDEYKMDGGTFDMKKILYDIDFLSPKMEGRTRDVSDFNVSAFDDAGNPGAYDEDMTSRAVNAPKFDDAGNPGAYDVNEFDVLRGMVQDWDNYEDFVEFYKKIFNKGGWRIK